MSEGHRPPAEVVKAAGKGSEKRTRGDKHLSAGDVAYDAGRKWADAAQGQD